MSLKGKPGVSKGVAALWMPTELPAAERGAARASAQTGVVRLGEAGEVDEEVETGEPPATVIAHSGESSPSDPSQSSAGMGKLSDACGSLTQCVFSIPADLPAPTLDQ